jgi:hypothetical protein
MVNRLSAGRSGDRRLFHFPSSHSNIPTLSRLKSGEQQDFIQPLALQVFSLPGILRVIDGEVHLVTYFESQSIQFDIEK